MLLLFVGRTGRDTSTGFQPIESIGKFDCDDLPLSWWLRNKSILFGTIFLKASARQP